MTELNERQQQAVMTTEGPVLVLAGAGSGKTKVLTKRVAHLIRNGVHPLSVLAITFTNKAANEMKERISSELDTDVSHMWISTFHSMCVRILRMSGKAIGFGANFVIYDTDDTLRLIKKILERLGLKDDKYYAPRLVRSAVSKYKNTEGCTDDAFNFAEKYYPFLSFRFSEIVEAYETELKNQDAMDFDDLLLNTCKLFMSSDDVLNTYRNRFKYILVDEYQDTNMIQYHLVKLLAGERRNIFVVGDDDQSIYAFRGANIENILNFEKDYPGAVVIRLEQNYRSDIRILDAANCVIRNNRGRKGKTLWSDIKSGSKPSLYCAQNEYDEAEFIARRINSIVSGGGSYSDIAVLYRAHTLARNIEEKLRIYSVPYRVYGGMSFYERKEIKDILAYLTLLINPAADMAFLRVINTPKRGIGAVSLQKLSAIARENSCSLMDVARNADSFTECRSFRNKIQAFAVLIDEISEDTDEKSIHDIINDVIEKTKYYEMLDIEYAEEAQMRKENLEEFINSAYEFEKTDENASLSGFMQNISLLTDMDSSNEETGVSLMTVHAAKGLEFDTVFLAGVEENIFPSRMSVDEDNIEEERRLCYVAITRAKRNLFILNSRRRSYFGDVSFNAPSRFIQEIEPRFLNDISPKKEYRPQIVSKPAVPQQKQFFTGDIKVKTVPQNTDTGQFHTGVTVRHKAFGTGKILSVTGSGKQAVALVDFDKAGEKKMFLAFAPLEVLK